MVGVVVGAGLAYLMNVCDARKLTTDQSKRVALVAIPLLAYAVSVGIEGNGWSNLLAIGAGGILMFSAQLHWSAKTSALIVGLGFIAAAIIALVDGNDVLGIFAANDATKLAWAITGAVLVVVGLLPRVGRKAADEQAPEEPVVAEEDRTRVEEPATTPMDARARDDRFDRDAAETRADGAVSERRAERT